MSTNPDEPFFSIKQGMDALKNTPLDVFPPSHPAKKPISNLGQDHEMCYKIAKLMGMELVKHWTDAEEWIGLKMFYIQKGGHATHYELTIYADGAMCLDNTSDIDEVEPIPHCIQICNLISEKYECSPV